MRAIKKYQKYLATIVVAPIFFFAILMALIYFFDEQIPAPRLSSSESFNEKARWIRNNLPNGCDVLIIGSSMALNNVDGDLIKEFFPRNSVLNAGSWGLGVSDSKTLLKYLVTACRPKVIIFSTYFGDFDNQWEKTIDWDLFVDYIHSKSMLSTYLKSLDIKYYVSTFIGRKRMEVKGNRTYQSLAFNNTGSVMLDCKNFEVDPTRWDAQDKYKTLNENNVNENLSELKILENIAKENHSQLILIRTPLRKVAEVVLLKPEIERLWMNVSQSLSDSGSIFLTPGKKYNFTDEQFVDFAHLNKCGASKEIEFIIPAIAEFLQS